jgi:hypothetical protein
VGGYQAEVNSAKSDVASAFDAQLGHEMSDVRANGSTSDA